MHMQSLWFTWHDKLLHEPVRRHSLKTASAGIIDVRHQFIESAHARATRSEHTIVCQHREVGDLLLGRHHENCVCTVLLSDTLLKQR